MIIPTAQSSAGVTPGKIAWRYEIQFLDSLLARVNKVRDSSSKAFEELGNHSTLATT